MKNQELRSNCEIADNAGMMFVAGPEADLTGADLRGTDLQTAFYLRDEIQSYLTLLN